MPNNLYKVGEQYDAVHSIIDRVHPDGPYTVRAVNIEGVKAGDVLLSSKDGTSLMVHSDGRPIVALAGWRMRPVPKTVGKWTVWNMTTGNIIGFFEDEYDAAHKAVRYHDQNGHQYRAVFMTGEVK